MVSKIMNRHTRNLGKLHRERWRLCVSTFLKIEKASPPTHSWNNPKIIIPTTIPAASSPDLVTPI
jgi:hypothetical protein